MDYVRRSSKITHRRKAAWERTEQRERSDARMVAKLLKGLRLVSTDRGNALSTDGQMLYDALAYRFGDTK